MRFIADSSVENEKISKDVYACAPLSAFPDFATRLDEQMYASIRDSICA
jgi:hypothetical protein